MKRGAVVSVGLIVVAVLAVAIGVPQSRWRLEVIGLYLAGKIPDIELGELIRFLSPASAQKTARLVETRSPHAVIENFNVAPADVAAGAALYRSQCARCHAQDGSGGPGGPALAGRAYKRGAGDWAVYRVIHLGVPGTAMPAHPLPPTQLWQLVAFLRSIDAPGETGSAAARQEKMPAVRVSAAELEATAKPGADWLTYSGSLDSARHSALGQITPDNVGQLALRWQRQFDGDPKRIETTPLVRNGVMYATLPLNRVMALDAATGRILWDEQYPQPSNFAGGEFDEPVNRGAAILDDRIFVGTGGAHLLARSAATGKVLWDAATSDDPTRYYISAAPLAFRDLVVTGVGNKGGGIGYVVAYDAASGVERWRFSTIPRPNQPGNETWAGNSWREGGAPTWLTGSYDAALDLVIWGVGNPKPDYDAAARAGDNLYSNSVVALEGRTGRLAWHFQFTPADDRDWDANQIPVLAGRRTADGIEKTVLWANRNGFYYVLDRTNGKMLLAKPFVRQTWTDGIDAHGRPLPRTDRAVSREGVVMYPGNVGGTNWWSPSLDAALNLLFVPVIEQGMMYFRSANSWPKETRRAFHTAVRALDAHTGDLLWEFKHAPRTTDPETGGLLSTDSSLLFGSDRGTFFALDSRTGKKLWEVETGGLISSAPMTYQVNGEQHVSIAAGQSLMTFALPRTPGYRRSTP